MVQITTDELLHCLEKSGIRLTQQTIRNYAKEMPDGMAVKLHNRLWLFRQDAVEFIINRKGGVSK